MALTGVIFVGFVISHMAGNLKIFGGINAESGLYKFDEYAHFLREIAAPLVGHGTLLWIARIVLLGSIFLHMLMAFQLAMINRAAKPVAVHNPEYRSANAASRTMKYGGFVLFIFIIYHILHFTTGHLHFGGFAEGQVYANVHSGFSNLFNVIFYIIAMACLALHLYHGTWSLFQTLGVDNPAWNKGIRTAAKLVSILVFLGFISVPLAVAFKVVDAPVITTMKD